MTIGGRKIQTRSPAVSATNTNDLSPTFVTPSHWLVDIFLSSDWQKPQLYFPIWLMFVSRETASVNLVAIKISHMMKFNNPLFFPFNSTILSFPGTVGTQLLCRFIYSAVRHIILSPRFKCSVSFKYSKEGKKLSPRVKFLWTEPELPQASASQCLNASF